MTRVSLEARAMLVDAYADADPLRLKWAVAHFELVREFERRMEQR